MPKKNKEHYSTASNSSKSSGIGKMMIIFKVFVFLLFMIVGGIIAMRTYKPIK